MAQSTDFLQVHEEPRGGRHRSRSSGQVDFLADQQRVEREELGMAMKKYHDSHSRYAQTPSDRLHVPTFEHSGNRRVRSQEAIGEKKQVAEGHPSAPARASEPLQSYQVREQRPQYDLSGDGPLPSQLPVRHKPQRGPSIKVQIHQADPPSPAKLGDAPQKSPQRSPSASPRSPTARPELQYYFTNLQNKLSDVEAICAPNLHVEAANPRDMTFSKIADDVRGYAFQLRVWGYVTHVEDLARFDSRKRDIVDLAAKTLKRLLERVTELSDACSTARPQDLKMALIPEIDDGEGYDSYDDDDRDDGSVKDMAESQGFIIKSHLQSIQLHINTLGRLTKSLQEASPESKDEVIAVDKLVKEVDQYFGSTEALERYSIDPKFAGGKALEEARYAARLRG